MSSYANNRYSHEIHNTILNLIQRMEKKKSILKNEHFPGKGRQSFHII